MMIIGRRTKPMIMKRMQPLSLKDIIGLTLCIVYFPCVVTSFSPSSSSSSPLFLRQSSLSTTLTTSRRSSSTCLTKSIGGTNGIVRKTTSSLGLMTSPSDIIDTASSHLINGNLALQDLTEAVTATTTAAMAAGTSNNNFIVSKDVLSSTILLSRVSFDDLKELSKSIFIILLFGGGLIPAAIAANTSMIGTIMGTRRGGDTDEDDDGQPSATSLDPYKRKGIKKLPYVTNSNASGPALPLSGLLFAKEAIPLVDIIAIIGRLPNLNSVADWNNLPSTTLPNVNKENPPMWLPRSTFKQNVRRANFAGWPIDSKTGQPVGGDKLQKEEESRIRQKDVAIGDAALDAVFDTWAWGASVATPDKVQSQLRGWRPNEETFSLFNFVAAAIRGRSVTGLGIITFIVIQTIAYGTLFVAPFLRVFFDFDIGFGELGSCSSPNGCTTFNDFFS